MVKVVENNERICTVNLDGSECSIVFQSHYKYFTVKNESDSEVYISLKRDIAPEADGVMMVNSKESATITNMQPNANMFFASGSGKIQVFASNTDNFINPFKSAPVATGGGGETTGYISDGLISFSELNDTLTCNLITDKMLGRNVNYCDGTNGYLKVSNPNTTSQMSAEFTLQVLIRTITSDAQMFGVIYDSSFRSAVFCINDGYFGLERASGHISTEILINDNEWHMLTAAYDGAIMRLYVDGASILEYEHTWDIPSNAVICIGQWQTGSSKYIGYIANACIYNRALSDSEILQNWELDVERYGIGETKT